MDNPMPVNADNIFSMNVAKTMSEYNPEKLAVSLIGIPDCGM